MRILWFLAGLFLLANTAQAQNIFTDDVQMCSGHPWIDVRCNGALGDGSHDDTSAINTTFSAAITNSVPVYFPSGTYKITSKITVDYQGIAGNGLQIISAGATLDGRTIPSGNVLQIICSGGTTGSPAVCNHLQISGSLTVTGTTAGYVVVIGKTDFSDRHNAARIEHLVVNNNDAGGAIQANYLTDGDLWLSGSTAGGSSSVGAVALEQVQTSRIGGWGSAVGASAPALLIENGASVGNGFAGFAYDPNASTCVSITSTSAIRNSWSVPYFPCVTAISAPNGPNQNVLLGPSFAGNNMGPTSGGFSIVGRGSLSRYTAPAVASRTLAGADDGTIFSAANATGPSTQFTAASLAVTLPDPAAVGTGWAAGFVTDQNKAVVLTASAGKIMLAGQQLSSLTVGAAGTAVGFETAVLQSDGANFRVTHLSQGSALLAGAQTTLPARWEFVGGPGYQATQGDNGMMISAAQVSSTLAVTLPQTTQIQPGYMVGMAADSHHPVTVSLSNTNGGMFQMFDGTQTASSQTFYANNRVTVFQFDGTYFRQIVNPLLGDARDFDADPTGTRDSTAALQNYINSRCNAVGNQIGGNIVFPPGIFATSDLTVPCGGVRISGASVGFVNTAQGTTLNCTMSDHCIKFAPAGWPNIINKNRGGSVENINFNVVGGAGRVIDMDGIIEGYIRHNTIWNTSQLANITGIRVWGVDNVTIDGNDVQLPTQYGIELMGDWSGKNSSGGACNLGSCSTRSDLVYLRGNGVGGTSTSTNYYIHDAMFGVRGGITNQAEFGLYGVRVTCASGQPNLGFCPQHVWLNGLDLENAIHPVSLTDFTDVKIDNSFIAGLDLVNTDHDIYAALQNYAYTAGGGGQFWLTNSYVWNANGSCVWIDVRDTQIRGNDIHICNGGNFGGAAGVEYHSGNSHHLADNTFCNVLGAVGIAFPQGYAIDAGANTVSASNNFYSGCTTQMTDNNQSGTNFEVNANPPPGPPVIAAGSGGSGVGTGTITVLPSSSDRGGQILLTAGSGAAALGALTISFKQAIFPAPYCNVTFERGSGVWNANASWTNGGLGLSATIYEIDWFNGGQALTPGDGYFISYECHQQGRG